MKIRTLRRWLAADLLSPTTFRGPATTYGPRHLEEVRAIVRFRADNLTLAAIRRDLRKLSEADLARLVRPGAPAAEPPVPPIDPVQPHPVTPSAPLDAATASATQATATYPVARWDHIVLIPGLELLVRSDGGPLLRRLAQEIYEQYGAPAP